MNSKIILVLAMVVISIGLYGLTSARPAPVVAQQVPIKEVKYKVWRLNKSVEKGDQLRRKDVEIDYLTRIEAAQFGIGGDVELNWSKPLFAMMAIANNELITPELIVSPGEDNYLNTVIETGFVPFNVTVPGKDVLGGTIGIGDLVDISVLSAPKQNLATEETVSDIQHLTMTPLLAQIPVLDMIRSEKMVSTLTETTETEVTLILQVTNSELAKLTVAKRIAEIAVHKSIGKQYVEDLHADSADIIPSLGKNETIHEYRFK